MPLQARCAYCYAVVLAECSSGAVSGSHSPAVDMLCWRSADNVVPARVKTRYRQKGRGVYQSSLMKQSRNSVTMCICAALTERSASAGVTASKLHRQHPTALEHPPASAAQSGAQHVDLSPLFWLQHAALVPQQEELVSGATADACSKHCNLDQHSGDAFDTICYLPATIARSMNLTELAVHFCSRYD